MSKLNVALLILLASVVVSGSPPRASASTPDMPAQVSGISAQDVARIVSGVNPHLSSRELARIGRAVVRYSAKYQIDPELVTAVLLVESSARPWALSPKGAVGLMQVMPYMGARMGVAGNLATIESNVEAGCMILASNIARLGEEDGISAYFWGSNIRGVAYLGRIQAARAEVRRRLQS
jgi:soluble lytic murein transglycosylase-like protein